MRQDKAEILLRQKLVSCNGNTDDRQYLSSFFGINPIVQQALGWSGRGPVLSSTLSCFPSATQPSKYMTDKKNVQRKNLAFFLNYKGHLSFYLVLKRIISYVLT